MDRQKQMVHEDLANRTMERIGSFAKHAPSGDLSILYIPAVRSLEIDYSSERDSNMFSRRKYQRIAKELNELRTLMYDEEVGTWISFSAFIRKDFTFSVSFNYYDEPLTMDGGSFGKEAFIKDVRLFPRSIRHIPDWLYSSIPHVK